MRRSRYRIIHIMEIPVHWKNVFILLKLTLFARRDFGEEITADIFWHNTHLILGTISGDWALKLRVHISLVCMSVTCHIAKKRRNCCFSQAFAHNECLWRALFFKRTLTYLVPVTALGGLAPDPRASRFTKRECIKVVLRTNLCYLRSFQT